MGSPLWAQRSTSESGLGVCLRPASAAPWASSRGTWPGGEKNVLTQAGKRRDDFDSREISSHIGGVAEAERSTR